MSLFITNKNNKVDSSEFIRTVNNTDDEVAKPAEPATPETTESK
jgi:hypothetical protein